MAQGTSAGSPESAPQRPATLLLLSATEFEVAPLTADFAPLTADQWLPQGWHARAGTIDGVPCVALATGVGKVNAAALTALAAQALRPKALLLVGIGGAFPDSGLKPGQVALAITDTHLDTGLGHGASWSGMESLGFPLLAKSDRRPEPLYNRMPVAASSEALARKLGVSAAHFGTADSVTASPETARVLGKVHGVGVESMEGAAVAQVAAALGVRLFQVRGLSNMVGDRNKANWRVPEAVATSCAAARQLIPLLMEEQ